jgi:hypothetical protein
MLARDIQYLDISWVVVDELAVADSCAAAAINTSPI